MNLPEHHTCAPLREWGARSRTSVISIGSGQSINGRGPVPGPMSVLNVATFSNQILVSTAGASHWLRPSGNARLGRDVRLTSFLKSPNMRAGEICHTKACSRPLRSWVTSPWITQLGVAGRSHKVTSTPRFTLIGVPGSILSNTRCS